MKGNYVPRGPLRIWALTTDYERHPLIDSDEALVRTWQPASFYVTDGVKIGVVNAAFWTIESIVWLETQADQEALLYEMQPCVLEDQGVEAVKDVETQELPSALQVEIREGETPRLWGALLRARTLSILEDIPIWKEAGNPESEELRPVLPADPRLFGYFERGYVDPATGMLMVMESRAEAWVDDYLYNRCARVFHLELSKEEERSISHLAKDAFFVMQRIAPSDPDYEETVQTCRFTILRITDLETYMEELFGIGLRAVAEREDVFFEVLWRAFENDRKLAKDSSVALDMVRSFAEQSAA